jgi:hypothetical protein
VVLILDLSLLARFPKGYRHLGYLQSQNGLTIKDDPPNLQYPAVEKLCTEGKACLDGSERPGEITEFLSFETPIFHV